MTVLEIIFIGVSLAMDAFALTIANCTTYKNTLSKIKLWSMPIFFGAFQFLMPVLGYYIGSIFSYKLQNIAGYLTFAVFFILALKIVFDNIREMRENEEKDISNSGKFNFGVLSLQALATSIDALIIGITFSLSLNSNIFLSSLIIGAVTFAIVTVALYIGKGLGKALGKYSTWAGAVILFTLSIKELITAII